MTLITNVGTVVVKDEAKHLVDGAWIQAECLYDEEDWSGVVRHVDQVLGRDDYEPDGRVITEEQADKAIDELHEWRQAQ